MAELYDIMKPENKYWDRKSYLTQQAYNAALSTSSTVYVGNLSFFTQPNSIKELFSRTGNVKDIIMGIDNEGHSCGFCFVIYETKREAELACEYISRTRLNGRIIRVDMDPGYIEGREKGRGTSGQQRREDFRTKEDPDRPRKMVKTGGYQNEGRGGYYNKDRGEGNRWDRGEGGHRGGQGSYRGGEGGYRGDRGGDRGGQRRQYRPRDNSRYQSNRQQRGQRRGYNENRQPRENRQPKERPEPAPQKNPQNEDY